MISSGFVDDGSARILGARDGGLPQRRSMERTGDGEAILAGIPWG